MSNVSKRKSTILSKRAAAALGVTKYFAVQNTIK